MELLYSVDLARLTAEEEFELLNHLPGKEILHSAPPRSE